MKRILSIAVITLSTCIAVASLASGVLTRKWSSNIVAGTLEPETVQPSEQPTPDAEGQAEQPVLDAEEHSAPEQLPPITDEGKQDPGEQEVEENTELDAEEQQS